MFFQIFIYHTILSHHNNYHKTKICRKRQSKLNKFVNENNQIEVVEQRSKPFDFNFENKQKSSFDYHEFDLNIYKLVQNRARKTRKIVNKISRKTSFKIFANKQKTLKTKKR